MGLVALTGCLENALPGDGRAVCAQGPERCPPGYYCATDNTCWRLGEAPDLSEDFAVCPVEGEPCGVDNDVCHDAPTCKAGVCTPNPKPDNTVCDDPKMVCKDPGVCIKGVCGAPTNSKDGTSCTTPADRCHLAGTCTGGVCGAETTLSDGFQYDVSNYKFRCCGGQEAQLDQSPNCGACGIKCRNNNNCVAGGPMQYWCACVSGANTDCWSGCCTTNGHICSPSDCNVNIAHCITCPGGASCVEDMTTHYYCHY
jgi:hypothetical protein